MHPGRCNLDVLHLLKCSTSFPPAPFSDGWEPVPENSKFDEEEEDWEYEDDDVLTTREAEWTRGYARKSFKTEVWPLQLAGPLPPGPLLTPASALSPRWTRLSRMAACRWFGAPC